MAKIDNVDYEAIPGQASEMRGYGKQLNDEMTRAYSRIAEMHSSWYGDRYNDLVKLFNNMIPSMNEMLELVVTRVPSTLETVANNYSQADRGTNVTTVSEELPKKIMNLPVTKDVGMRFISSNVHETQGNVSKDFTNAKELMNQIEVVYRKIEWQSEAANAFRATFTKLKNNIATSFENINSQFTKLMEATKKDIDQAEKANTVN